MTPNRLAAIAFRYSISAVFALWLFAPNAQAQNAATAINGVYNGTYTCALGPRTLKLSLLTSGNGSLTGVFTFYLPPTSHTQAFSYSLSGTFDAASGKFKLNPVKWEVPPPGSYAMVGMDGAFDPGTGQVAGKITYGSCGAFQATRDQAESANSASVITPQKVEKLAGAAQPPPKTAATPPARQIPTAAATQGGATGSSASVVQNSAPPTARPTPPPPQNAALNQKPCNFLTKAEAESILGESVVQRSDSDSTCWFVQNAFAGGTGANNKQIDLSIWRSPAPKPDDVNSRRAGIAGDRGMAGIAVRDVADFADAALWSWTPRWGRFNAFKGGTSEVEVTIGGIDEAAALQNAKKLAARALGGTAKTGYAYAGAPGSSTQASTPASQVQSPAASPPRMPDLQQAREIWRFDKLASDDQIEYVNLLIDSVEAAIQPEQLAQVKRFFASKQAGETMSGMGQFELNLSLARVADLEAVEKNPKVRRLEVEDVMYVTLVVNGIALGKSFRPTAINFQPKRPSGTVVMTKAESYKALAQTQAWVGRTVPLDRELPTGPGTWNRGGFGLALFRSLAEGQAKAEANGEPGLKSLNQGTSDGAWRDKTKSYDDIVHEAKQRAMSACFDYNVHQSTTNTLRSCN